MVFKLMLMMMLMLMLMLMMRSDSPSLALYSPLCDIFMMSLGALFSPCQCRRLCALHSGPNSNS